MHKACRLLVIVGLLLGLAACSHDKPVHVASPLPQFDNHIHPKQLWDVQIGDGVGNYYSQLQPVVAYGHVYAADRSGIVESIDLKGERSWKTDISDLPKGKQFTADGNARISGGLLAANHKIYFGTENAFVFALDSKTGKVLWRKNVPGEVIASPSIGDDVLVVVTNSGNLLAMDPQSGQIQWTTKLDLPSLTLRGKAVPVVTNGVIILGRSNGSVAIYSLRNGHRLFSKQLAVSDGISQLDRLVDVDSQPLILGNELFAIAYNGSLIALNLRNGQSDWKRSYSAYRDMAMSGSELFLTDSRSHIIGIERLNGSELWQQRELQYRNVTAPAVAGNYVLVGDSEGYLYWLDRDTGHFAAKLKLDGDGLYVAPVVTDNLIIIQTRSGRLIAFKRA